MKIAPAEWTLRRRTRGLDPASLTRTRTRTRGERERQAPECPGNALGDTRTGDLTPDRGVGAPGPGPDQEDQDGADLQASVELLYVRLKGWTDDKLKRLLAVIDGGELSTGGNTAPETSSATLTEGVTSEVPNPLTPLTLGVEMKGARVAVRVCSTVHIDPKTTSQYLLAEMMKEEGIRDTLRPHLPTLTLTDPAHLCDLWTCVSRLESAEEHHG